MTDTHIHSTLSFDGENTAEEMIKASIEKGLSVIALTEHLDVNELGNEYYRFEELIKKGFSEIPPLQKKYGDRITLLYGVELGQALSDAGYSLELLEKHDYDYVLGSIHAVNGYKDFYYIDFNSMVNTSEGTAEIKNLLIKYFNEILEMIKWGKQGRINAIAHLTYPLRYIIGRSKIDFDILAYDEINCIIDEIFLEMIKHEIVLEINTGGLRADNYNRTDPDFYYIKRYFDFGGRLVTIGSDAHRVPDIGKGYETAMFYAKQAGFDKITCFKKRKPFFINIE